jgi:hypothetical protein
MAQGPGAAGSAQAEGRGRLGWGTRGGATKKRSGNPVALAGDTLYFHRGELAAVINARRKGVTPEQAIEDHIVHELIHGAANHVVGHEEAEDIARTAPEALRKLAAKAYHGFENLTPWQQGHEMLRMVVEGRYRGRITEQVYKALQKILDALGIDIRRLPENGLLKSAADRVKALVDAHGIDLERSRVLTEKTEGRDLSGDELSDSRTTLTAAGRGGDGEGAGGGEVSGLAGEHGARGEGGDRAVPRGEAGTGQPERAAQGEQPTTEGSGREPIERGDGAPADASAPAVGEVSDADGGAAGHGEQDHSPAEIARLKADWQRQEAEARGEDAAAAMRENGYVSLFEAVKKLGGLPGGKHALAGHYGEELKRVLDALRGHNARSQAEAGGPERKLVRHLFSDTAKSPDDVAQQLGFDDPNALMHALEAELTTGQPHWVHPDAEGERTADGTSQERLGAPPVPPGVDEFGVHPVAKARPTRYESADERFTDPAQVLEAIVRGDGGTGQSQQRKHGRIIASHSRLSAWGGAGPSVSREAATAAVQAGTYGGGEHVVFPDPESGRWVKMTKPALYGAQGQDAGAYLQRWALSNHVFGDDVRYEGQIHLPGEHESRAVVSQPDVAGRDSTEAEVADYLNGKGFRDMGAGRWVNPVLGITAWDVAQEGNAITDAHGQVHPIDFQVVPSRAEELQRAREQTGIGKPEPLFAAPAGESDEPFYSQLTRTIHALPQETMTVQQARAAIEKGAKQAEIAQQGILTDPLSPLFGKAPGDKVSKADLVGFALEREAKVQDVSLGGVKHAEALKWEQSDKQGLQWAARDEEGRVRNTIEKMRSNGMYRLERDTGHRAYSTLQEAQAQAEQIHQNGNPPRETSHFASYTFPGADEGSYREMFVTWPTEPGWQDRAERYLASMRRKYGEDALSKMTEEERVQAYKYADKVTAPTWQDGHGAYDHVANPIVRIRRNLRTDAHGKKTYFLEEIQGPNKAGQELMPPELRKRIYEIGMKRAIRDAIDQGADAIGWTTGEQQADRYSLQRDVEGVEVSKNQDGTYEIAVKPLHSEDYQHVGRPIKPDELEQTVGKELAKKIVGSSRTLEERTLTFNGGDLKIGGEGLKNLYDVMLPRIANKLAEKVGGKVGETRVLTQMPHEDDMTGESSVNRLVKVHSMELPKAWKEKAPEFTLYAAPAQGELLEHERAGDLFHDSAVDRAAAGTHTDPTEAQKEAGNYRKGHTRISGLDISIENPAGSVRSGQDRSGKPWSVEMGAHYGYIRGTEGRDGDHVT